MFLIAYKSNQIKKSPCISMAGKCDKVEWPNLGKGVANEIAKPGLIFLFIPYNQIFRVIEDVAVGGIEFQRCWNLLTQITDVIVRSFTHIIAQTVLLGSEGDNLREKVKHLLTSLVKRNCDHRNRRPNVRRWTIK